MGWGLYPLFFLGLVSCQTHKQKVIFTDTEKLYEEIALAEKWKSAEAARTIDNEAQDKCFFEEERCDGIGSVVLTPGDYSSFICDGGIYTLMCSRDGQKKVRLVRNEIIDEIF